MSKFFLGIDIGTQGARVITVDENGGMFGSGSRKFSRDEGFREEQSVDIWWNDCLHLLDEIFENLDNGIDKKEIIAISVTATSGTVIPLDDANKPLHKAIMYSDPRSS